MSEGVYILRVCEENPQKFLSIYIRKLDRIFAKRVISCSEEYSNSSWKR